MKASVIALVLLLGADGSFGEDTVAPAQPASAAANIRPRPYQSPTTVPSAARIELPSVVVPAPPSPVVPQPAFSSNCDSTGCWGSDGKRYNAAADMLVRPDGTMCRDIAGVMQCP